MGARIRRERARGAMRGRARVCGALWARGGSLSCAMMSARSAAVDRRLPPGSRGLPLVGESLEFLRSPSAFVDRRLARHGRVFWSNVLGKPTVFMAGSAANQWIFAGEGRYLENEWSPAIRRLLGRDSLAMITGEAHRERRRLLAPHFKRGAMAEALPAVVSVAEAHLERWAAAAAEGPIAAVPRVRAMVFEIAARYVLGRPDDLGAPLEALSRDFDAWVGGLLVAVPVAVPGSRFGRAMAARRRIFGLLGELVARRAKDPEPGGPCVLTTLLGVRDEDGRPLPASTIVDELQLLLFAGHDTTVTGVANALADLAAHPAVMARAQAEQDALAVRGYTLEALRAMPYLEAALKESMRLVPPVGASFRVMLEDADFEGFTIPRGWRVAVGPRGTHRDPALWPDPERFDPERFLGGADERPLFAWIPFGGGPRVCLGQHFAALEMLVVMAMLLRGFTWSLTPGQDLRLRELPLPRMRSGTLLDLRRRGEPAG